ncbi:MarR family winged helix-turn-helix transcriptional regulator [Deinococcus oregonensis]|uniref:MarR family winged helix-turn-helix transcriptional regulator n=1 Tax=Deinococcus oregonensis TaxID=1805970 RepID=A0ABV6AUJ5_9DEIO
MIHPPSPPDLAAGQEVGLFLQAMWRFNRALGQQLEPRLQSEHGTDTRSYLLLQSIQKGVNYPKALAEELKIPSTLLSRYLDDLSKRGLIERQIDAQDSRRTRLTLTPAAEQLVGAVRRTIHDVAEARLSRLTLDQRRTLTETLRLLAQEGSAP